MLDNLRIRNVCLAPELSFSFAPRFNVVTGDNGLGKSFLLDIAWWALTRTWASQVAIPTFKGSPQSAGISRRRSRCQTN
jgi:predicted ATP-binding protein involved in virulence